MSTVTAKPAREAFAANLLASPQWCGESLRKIGPLVAELAGQRFAEGNTEAAGAFLYGALRAMAHADAIAAIKE
jgi:hypothetical protein